MKASKFNTVKKIKNKEASKNEFSELLRSENEAIQQAVLSNINFSENMQIALATDTTTPVEVMYALSNSYYVVVRNCLAANEKCPVEIIKIFIEKEDALMGVTSNINTPPDMLEAIFHLKNRVYKEFISANPSTPHQILKQLCKDKDEYIRMNIAINLSSSEDLLAVLASDISVEVRSNVAINKNTSSHILKQLLEDKSYVANIAKKSLNSKKSFEKSSLEDMKYYLFDIKDPFNFI
jgi:hypothetical protein